VGLAGITAGVVSLILPSTNEYRPTILLLGICVSLLALICGWLLLPFDPPLGVADAPPIPGAQG
jgi:hypothetical protein